MIRNYKLDAFGLGLLSKDGDVRHHDSEAASEQLDDPSVNLGTPALLIARSERTLSPKFGLLSPELCTLTTPLIDMATVTSSATAPMLLLTRYGNRLPTTTANTVRERMYPLWRFATAC